MLSDSGGTGYAPNPADPGRIYTSKHQPQEDKKEKGWLPGQRDRSHANPIYGIKFTASYMNTTCYIKMGLSNVTVIYIAIKLINVLNRLSWHTVRQ